jgi:hypothetical protein
MHDFMGKGAEARVLVSCEQVVAKYKDSKIRGVRDTELLSKKVLKRGSVFQNQNANRIIKVRLKEIALHNRDEAIRKVGNLFDFFGMLLVTEVEVFGLFVQGKLIQVILGKNQ